MVTSSAVYCSRGDAEKDGVEFVGEVKRMDLSKHRRKLEGMLGDAKPIVQEIVSAASG